MYAQKQMTPQTLTQVICMNKGTVSPGGKCQTDRQTDRLIAMPAELKYVCRASSHYPEGKLVRWGCCYGGEYLINGQSNGAGLMPLPHDGMSLTAARLSCTRLKPQATMQSTSAVMAHSQHGASVQPLAQTYTHPCCKPSSIKVLLMTLACVSAVGHAAAGT